MPETADGRRMRKEAAKQKRAHDASQLVKSQLKQAQKTLKQQKKQAAERLLEEENKYNSDVESDAAEANGGLTELTDDQIVERAAAIKRKRKAQQPQQEEDESGESDEEDVQGVRSANDSTEHYDFQHIPYNVQIELDKPEYKAPELQDLAGKSCFDFKWDYDKYSNKIQTDWPRVTPKGMSQCIHEVVAREWRVERDIEVGSQLGEDWVQARINELANDHFQSEYGEDPSLFNAKVVSIIQSAERLGIKAVPTWTALTQCYKRIAFVELGDEVMKKVIPKVHRKALTKAVVDTTALRTSRWNMSKCSRSILLRTLRRYRG
jgi:hypothetical protein